MANYLTSIHWERNGQDFNYETYDRTYTIKFNGGETIQASNPKEYFGNPKLPNPEELLVSALSGCYMQTFLALSCKYGYIIDSYTDDAVGITAKNEQGKTSVVKITLHLKLKFSGSELPDDVAINKIKEKALENCFISNSIKSVVDVVINT